jgi:SAM-dependent methyltransferase
MKTGNRYGNDPVRVHNATAWNKLVADGNEWTRPVSPAVIADARQGPLSLLLTPSKPVPADWLGDVRGKRILGLASGGGQQMPCLAAAGAVVTVIDNAPAQLQRDREVADREGLAIEIVEGDMRDLSAFADESFDLIFHPCSNCFVPDVRPVWREANSVLKREGVLLAGFANPIVFMLDLAKERDGIVQLKYKQPFAATDPAHAADPELRALREAGDPLDFGHTLQDQIGGQIDAGFAITGFYEDGWPADTSPLHALMNAFIATRARKG